MMMVTVSGKELHKIKINLQSLKNFHSIQYMEKSCKREEQCV